MRRAVDWPCVFTGEPADHLHHQAGRGPDGEYLFPKLVAPVVRVQHVLEHQAWRVAGVTDGTVGDPAFLLLMRLGLSWVRLSEYHHPGHVILPTFTVVEHGHALIDIARSLRRGRSE